MEYRVLGPLDVRTDDRALDLGGLRQRRILAMLLLHADRVVSVTRLAEAAWAEETPATMRRQVQNRVAALRSVLTPAGGFIDTADDGYLLRVRPGELDTHVFDDLVARGRAAGDPAVLRQALGLWRGPALSGLGGSVLDREAAALEEQRLAVIEDCVELELATGRYEALVGELRELVRANPLRERLVGQLMLALHRSGRSDRALAAYDELAGRLAEELGLDPGPELRRLRDGLGPLPGNPPPAQPPAHLPTHLPAQLPADVSGFTGRMSDLLMLDEILVDGHASPTLVISAIAGTAGVGKTALAVRWAHRIRDKFADGQLYVNLRGHAQTPPLRPIDALAGFVRALGVDAHRVPTELTGAVALYRDLVAGKRLLVVLDNAADAEQVRPLLPAGPGSLALVTSRDALDSLVERDGARRLTLDVLSAGEAGVLLARILGAARADAEPAAVAELARLCAYLPLALRITAANLADGESIAGYVARLATGNRLAGLSVEGDRQAAVRAAFDLSYAALPGPAQRMFRLLGLVPGPDVTAEAAAALADLSIVDAAVLLGRLAAAHLVDQHAPGRYAFHDLLRLYAGEHVRADPEPAAAVRLYDFYVHAARAATDVLYPGVIHLPLPECAPGVWAVPAFAGPTEALAWLDAERPNLVAAAASAATATSASTAATTTTTTTTTAAAAATFGPPHAAWLLTDALRGYLFLRANMVDGMTVARAGLAAAESAGEPRAQAMAHLSLANMYTQQSGYTQAVEHLTITLDTARRTGWPEAQSAALGALGTAYRLLGQPQRAADHLAEALVLDRRLDRRAGVAVGLVTLGTVYREMGRLEQACACHLEALALYQAAGARSGQATVHDNLAEAYHDLGRLDEAREHVDRAEVLCREAGARDAEADVLRIRAAVDRASGDHERAVERAGAALELAREIGVHRYEANATILLAALYDDRGRYAEAIDLGRQALRLTRDSGNRYPEIEALLGLATAAVHCGQITEAASWAGQALEAAVGCGYRILEDRARTVCAEIRLAGRGPA
jgi:DNA-binding SARP family transcriptional activator/tetratricopeptide (TPR) repeat protein